MPSRKQDLIIISAGKFGRETFAWAAQAIAAGAPWRIKGFLDNRAEALKTFDYGVGILGDVENYEIEENDVFVGAIGAPQDKVKYYTPILQRGGRFVNVIHPLANMGKNVQLGVGIVLAPFASVTCDVRIGDHVSIGPFSNSAHDTIIGDWSQISSHCGINGNVSLGTGVFLGSHACIIPRIKIGDWAFVGAGSVVTKDVEADLKVFGNPAAIIGRRRRP
ncbi:MAG: NeuD/PglB/VioB family sugar acetyltransferase [Limisphaerales bacterium]